MRLVALLVLATLSCGTGTEIKDVQSAQADSGTPRGVDPPPTPITDPFAGAPAYAQAGPPSGDDPQHNTGKSCSLGNECHGKNAPAFLVGGTVYSDYAGTVPAAGVEVRIVDGSGHSASTHSDKVGNFWIHSAGSNVTFPAWVGARDASGTRPMITTLTSIAQSESCAQASCHENPPVSPRWPIHVP